MATLTPLATTSSVPSAVEGVMPALMVEAAVTVNGSLPAAVPGAGVSVSVTVRKLFTPAHVHAGLREASRDASR